MESPVCIKQPQGQAVHALEVTFSWNFQRYYLWGQETVTTEHLQWSHLFVKQTAVVYALEVLP